MGIYRTTNIQTRRSGAEKGEIQRGRKKEVGGGEGRGGNVNKLNHQAEIRGVEEADTVEEKETGRTSLLARL